MDAVSFVYFPNAYGRYGLFWGVTRLRYTRFFARKYRIRGCACGEEKARTPLPSLNLCKSVLSYLVPLHGGARPRAPPPKAKPETRKRSTFCATTVSRESRRGGGGRGGASHRATANGTRLPCRLAAHFFTRG